MACDNARLHLPTLLWIYCPGNAGVAGDDRADRLASKATLASGSSLGRSEAPRSLINYLLAQNQGHHTIDRLADRGIVKGGGRRSTFKGRDKTVVNQTNTGTTCEKCLRDGAALICAFPSAYIPSKTAEYYSGYFLSRHGICFRNRGSPVLKPLLLLLHLLIHYIIHSFIE